MLLLLLWVLVLVLVLLWVLAHSHEGRAAGSAGAQTLPASPAGCWPTAP